MKAALALAFLASAWAACDTSTCGVCQNMTGCGWWTLAGTSDCRTNSSDLATLGLSYTTAGNCPACQAGSCTDCQAQAGCSWYTHPSVLMRSVCSFSNSTPPTPSGIPGSYTPEVMCPPCKDLADCTTCNANPNCTWYRLPGGTSEKCAEIGSSPGSLYSRVSGPFCNNTNPCGGVENCAKCTSVTGQMGNVSNASLCQWLTPKSGLTSLYNAKCDYNYGTLDSAFYDVLQGACPVCTGATCTACKSEANCKWSAVSVLGVLSFGQCLASTTATPAGKTDIATCPAECQIYSCSQCVANTNCRWFTGAATDDTCDRASDTAQHPFSKVVSSVANCPACKDSRCYECNNEAGCSWYVNTLLGADIPGTGDCAPTHTPSSTERLVSNTDKKCAGVPGGAGALAPSLMAFVVAFFVYHN